MGSDERRIILVDDEEALVWSLSTRLMRTRPAWTVQTANDGETALAHIKECSVDLLVAADEVLLELAAVLEDPPADLINLGLELV